MINVQICVLTQRGVFVPAKKPPNSIRAEEQVHSLFLEIMFILLGLFPSFCSKIKFPLITVHMFNMQITFLSILIIERDNLNRFPSFYVLFMFLRLGFSV